MKTVVAVFLLLCAAPAVAQDRLATSVFLGGVIADDLTTWHNMRNGHAETDPLYGFVKESPKGVMISLAVTDALTLWLAHRYAPTHPKIVRAVLFGLGGIRFGQGVRNTTIWIASVPALITEIHPVH